MAQEKKLFTLEDLNFGGNNFYNLQPQNKYYEWWGDQLVRNDVEECYLDLLYDPQTSGGLLVSLPAEYKDAIMDDFEKIHMETAVSVAGYVYDREEEYIRLHT